MIPQTLQARDEPGVLATGLVHEIRNRLNTIRFSLSGMDGGLDRMRAGSGAGSALKSLIHDIADELSLIERIMREFLQIASPEPPQVQPVDVADSLASVVRSVEDACLDQDVRLSWDCSPDVRVRADPQQLNQVLCNLVQNAVQAMPHGGRIRLRGSVGCHHAIMEVSDTGPGIPEAVRPQMFQPFFSTKREQTGLGLSICRKLVDQMNGRLEFQTDEGQGTTFVVRLPRLESRDDGTDSSGRRRCP
jgi:two-component system, NtrC family, sensor histidine kinase HydH